MAELSYSFHLGRDKNKRTSSRSNAKNNLSGSTSLANNGIQNARQLSKVNNHDFRKYDEDTRGIYTLKGCNDIVHDVKEFYKIEFEDARLEYNNKQSRPSRMINDYFQHVSDDEKKDLACEIIIELGNKEFWDEKNLDERQNMVEVYNEQVLELERLVPEFKITNAVVHLDETSPHMHIVGVPVKYNCKTGMKMQVGKSDVFTKERLTKIQDKMREKCIESFNKYYKEEATLKEKQKGRNRDIHVKDMQNYNEIIKQMKVNKESIDKADKMINKFIKDEDELSEMFYDIDQNKDSTFTLSEKQMIRFMDLTTEVRDMSKQFDDLKYIYNDLLQFKDKFIYYAERNNELIKQNDKLISKNQDFEKKFKDYEDTEHFLKTYIKKKDDEHLDLITYLCKHANSKDYTTSRLFKQMADDLYQKGFIKEKEHNIIFRPPKTINKSEINSALKSLNRQMDEAAEEFYQTKKDDYSL
jgi:hypothetical protein